MDGKQTPCVIVGKFCLFNFMALLVASKMDKVSLPYISFYNIALKNQKLNLLILHFGVRCAKKTFFI